MAILKLLDSSHYGNIKKGWFLSYYFTTKCGIDDDVSKYLLRFKDGTEPYTSKWIEIATSFFKKESSFDLILRVLSSEETQCINSKSLDKLALEISKNTGGQYLSSCLYKTRPTKPMKFLNRNERFEEIHQVYRFLSPNKKPQNILLLDDIITSGTTITEIKRAIDAEIENSNIYLFVLGKTYDSWNDKEAENSEIQKLFDSK